MHPRPATATDIPAVVDLVQSAYRGDASRVGWTTEADLLGGQRADAEMVGALLGVPGSTVLVLDEAPAPGHAPAPGEAPAPDDAPARPEAHAPAGRLLACCHVQDRPGGACYVGLLAVRPDAQARGLGRVMLAAAEEHARRTGARRMEMTVIAQRPELIAWYERNGFVDTGERSPFPYGDERFGLPLRPDLEFRHLARALAVG